MRKLCASDLMNSEVLTVRDDMSVQELADFLTDNEIGGAPVLDADGRLIGVVSMVDIVAVTSDEEKLAPDERNPDFYLRDLQEAYSDEEIQELHIDEGEELSVRDIMTASVYSVSEDATVSEVASMMLQGHLHRVLVTRDDELVGIISTSDLLGLLVDEN